MANAQAEVFKRSQIEPYSRFDVLIIGAGIGGLSLAIVLAQAGHRVSTVERKPSFDTLSSEGGINLTANAICSLQSMGIGERLEQIADPVPQILVKTYATGETISTRHTTRPSVHL